MMAANSRERLSSLVDSAKLASNIPSKLDYLRHLKQDLLQEDLALLSELLPRIFDLLSDRFSPIRKFATEYALRISNFIYLFFFNSNFHLCFHFTNVSKVTRELENFSFPNSLLFFHWLILF